MQFEAVSLPALLAHCLIPVPFVDLLGVQACFFRQLLYEFVGPFGGLLERLVQDISLRLVFLRFQLVLLMIGLELFAAPANFEGLPLWVLGRQVQEFVDHIIKVQIFLISSY